MIKILHVKRTIDVETLTPVLGANVSINLEWLTDAELMKTKEQIIQEMGEALYKQLQKVEEQATGKNCNEFDIKQ